MIRLLVMLVIVTAISATAPATAPIPKETPKPAAVAIRHAIGKSHLGKEVRAIGRVIGEDPVIHYPLWKQDILDNTEETHFYLKWKTKGLELCFVRGNLHTAWTYNENENGFRKYAGELPEKLSFEDSADSVEKKLGKPEIVLRIPSEADPGEKNELKIDKIYKKKGICVTFRRSPKGEAVITAIALFPPGEAPCW